MPHVLSFERHQSCAVMELSGLRLFVSARDTMISFCEHQFKKQNQYQVVPGNPFYAFYVFSAATDDKGGPEPNGRDGKRAYGAEFAEFIRALKFGNILESGVRDNAFHPEHRNQLWVWEPDAVAIRAWWDAQPESITEISAPATTNANTKMDEQYYQNHYAGGGGNVWYGGGGLPAPQVMQPAKLIAEPVEPQVQKPPAFYAALEPNEPPVPKLKRLEKVRRKMLVNRKGRW